MLPTWDKSAAKALMGWVPSSRILAKEEDILLTLADIANAL